MIEIKNMRVDELIPYVNNARKHSDSQVAQIAASIREFGFNNPILTDGSNGVIAGHGRLMAAIKLGLETAPVIELSHLSEIQKRAYILADNRIAENATWDEALIQVELEALASNGFDILLTGFDLMAEDDQSSSEKGDDGGIDYQEKYAVLIECENEQEQTHIFNRLSGMGLACKVLVN